MSYFARARMLLLSAVVGIAGTVYAGEIVRIDQSKALAGGVTQGDAPGFPVTISESGSYKLTSNLNVTRANGTGIEITAPNVTIDMNGFSIIGPTQCTENVEAPPTCPARGTGVGIKAGSPPNGGPRNVKIFNGNVRGMSSDGINIIGDGSMVQNVSADLNVGSGFIVNGSVLQSSATDNGLFGMLASIVRDSQAIDNVSDGIILDGRGGVAIGNLSTGNGGRGIVPQNASVNSNIVTLNSGIGVSAICPSSIVDNTIVANRGGSVQTNDGTCVLVNNANRP